MIHLHLDNNQIASIKADAFNGLNKVEWLYLENNQIASIEANRFMGLNNLKYLYLQNNQIVSIGANAFDGLNNLIGLDLQNNKIASIDVKTFKGLNRLETLRLDGNPFEKIENASNKTFKGVKYLLLLNENEWIFYPNAHSIESKETFTLTKDYCKEYADNRKYFHSVQSIIDSFRAFEYEIQEFKSKL